MLSKNSFTLLVATCLIPGASAQSKDIQISGARIELGNGQSIAAGTIVIHDGKIASVSERAAPILGDVIDGKGWVIYPGFIDAYSTRGVKIPDAPSTGTPPDTKSSAPPYMWHGNRKGIRSDVVASKNLDIKSGLSDNYAQGITTALLAPGGATIRGIATVVDYTATGNVLSPMAAAEMSFRGGGTGGTGEGYPGTLFGIIALMRQTLADAQYYAAQTNPKKDDALANLGPLLKGQMPAIFAVDSAREMLRATRVADEFSFKLIVGSGRDAFKDIDLLKSKSIPVLVSVDLGIEPTKTQSKEPDSTPQAVLDERYATWVDRTQNAKKLSDAGVPIAFATYGASLDDYLKNIRTLIKGGLSKDVALKAMTSSPASILGVADKVGTIEQGKMANLVIMTGDFSDTKSEVESVYVEGVKTQVKKVASK